MTTRTVDLITKGSVIIVAGRIAYYELPGLALREVGARRADRLWMRGGFPKSFPAHSIGVRISEHR